MNQGKLFRTFLATGKLSLRPVSERANGKATASIAHLPLAVPSNATTQGSFMIHYAMVTCHRVRCATCGDQINGCLLFVRTKVFVICFVPWAPNVETIYKYPTEQKNGNILCILHSLPSFHHSLLVESNGKEFNPLRSIKKKKLTIWSYNSFHDPIRSRVRANRNQFRSVGSAGALGRGRNQIRLPGATSLGRPERLVGARKHKRLRPVGAASSGRVGPRQVQFDPRVQRVRVDPTDELVQESISTPTRWCSQFGSGRVKIGSILDPNSLHQQVGVAYAFSLLPESLHPPNLLVPFGSTRTTPGRLRMPPTRQVRVDRNWLNLRISKLWLKSPHQTILVHSSVVREKR